MQSTARLLIRIGSQPEQEYTLSQEVTILGREAINDLVVNDAEVSRRHSRIVLETDGFVIEDLGSTNGTFLNGQRVSSPSILYHGDTIELGKSARLVFLGSAPRDDAPAQPQQQQQQPQQSSGYVPAPIPQQQAQPAQPQQPIQYDDYEPYDQYSDQDQYYGRPPQGQSDAPQYTDQYDEYDDDDYDDEAGGCQRYLITCGCLLLLGVFLLFASLFILDQIAPDALYCGPLRGFWQVTIGPILEGLGRPLTCP